MSRHRHISDKKSNRRKLLKGLAIILAVVLVISVALLILRTWENQQGNVPIATPVDNTVTYNGQKYKAKNVDTFLVMGLDKYEGDIDSDSYNNDQQADFLMLFVIDNKNSTCTAVHINRDTMADIPVLGIAGEKVGTVNKQLALAHTYGDGGMQSCRNTATAVSGVLPGVEIHDYISVTMDSVPVFNDLVGGVEVTVLDDFTGIDDTLVKGEVVTLRGVHSLNYVRTRYGLDDSSNSTRMQRQRQYINALVDKASQCVEADDTFIFDALETVSKYMVSNCSVTQLEHFFESISSYDFSDIRYLEGENRMGETFMEFYPDEASTQQLIMELFYEPVH
ncbi:MAG: LCP family protein [Ruminococcus sp.]|nr:LCP family protein [Ruminococcus sp.]